MNMKKHYLLMASAALIMSCSGSEEKKPLEPSAENGFYDSSKSDSAQRKEHEEMQATLREAKESNAIAAKSNEEVLAIVKEEPKVKDAVITEAGVLYAGVLDDGTRRDGYAEYLCQLLRDNGAIATRVKVVKANSHNDPNKDNAYGVLLGEAYCN